MADKNPLSKIVSGASFIIVGFILIAIGLSLGGRWNFGWHFDLPWDTENSDSVFENGDSKMIRPISSSEGSFPSEIHSLDIEIPFGSVIVKTGDTPGYVFFDYSILQPKVHIEKERITIGLSGDKRKVFVPNSIESPRLEITLPPSLTLEDFVVELGAGSLVADDVVAENMRIKLGAGECRISGDILRKGSITTGAGSVSLSLFGGENVYDIDFSRGLGDVHIGEKSWSGSGSGTSGNLDANRKIKVSTGLGELRIQFAK